MPERGREIVVYYEDRDGNGYLSFNAPDRANVDRPTGATLVPREPRMPRERR